MTQPNALGSQAYQAVQHIDVDVLMPGKRYLDLTDQSRQEALGRVLWNTVHAPCYGRNVFPSAEEISVVTDGTDLKLGRQLNAIMGHPEGKGLPTDQNGVRGNTG